MFQCCAKNWTSRANLEMRKRIQVVLGVGWAVLTLSNSLHAQNQHDQTKSVAPVIAYVGTFSSPLKDMLPTQVDLPPGNGLESIIFMLIKRPGK